ncbi:YqgE/AlgH family protein [Urechidicola croceus]|uniref:Transcriptional regulator n=1 Tax=Urechidicola croceus TaxID=1850246 RepID=A0A1D8P4N6_9FLAO|nr:YqgE/AlgH family protein [Urechidicola croceus]AOW19550.1 transcriptional regulator [Urechidicola croceus]
MIELEPTKGRLLVAEPSILNDRSFNRSVVLLTEHNNTGSIGFIMNKPMKYKMNDLVPEIDCDFPVYNGGPVSKENLYFIHNIPHLIPDSVKIASGIYWGGNFDSVSKLLKAKVITRRDIRFFLGYSGWEANQLTEELIEDTWLVVENSYSNILTTNASMWKNKLMQLGGEYQIWANAPKNPSLN